MLNHMSEITIATAMVVAFVLAAEWGFRLAKRLGAAGDDHVKSHVSGLQNALLGLLALLIGFTLAMAVSRFDTRRELVLDESNAIGTAYLRSGLLSERYRKEAAQLLRRYVDVRLTFFDAASDPARLQAANRETAALQAKLWAIAIAAAETEPRPVSASLFVQALNEVIDLHEKRLRALESRVPDTVFYLLFLVAVVAVGFIGYGSGIGGKRYFLSTALVSLLLALVITIVIDLDRPRRGLIQVSESSMLQLKQSIADTP